MWVTTKVTYDGHPEQKSISLKRGVKWGFRAFGYLALLVGIVVAVIQLIVGGIIEDVPQPGPQPKEWGQYR